MSGRKAYEVQLIPGTSSYVIVCAMAARIPLPPTYNTRSSAAETCWLLNEVYEIGRMDERARARRAAKRRALSDSAREFFGKLGDANRKAKKAVRR